MKRLYVILLVPLLVATLTACDLFSKFIPPIEVGNVFGIGTAEAPTTLTVPAFQDPAALGPLRPATIGATDLEATEITFPNIELPDMYGFTLDALWVTLGIGDTITLERPTPSAATYPESFTLTAIEAYIHVSDEQNIRKAVEYHFTEQDPDLTFARQGTCSGATCTYQATATAKDLENAMIFQIPERDGRLVKDLIAIASEGGTNHARVKARLTANAPGGNLEGLAATIQLMNTSTKVSLGG